VQGVLSAASVASVIFVFLHAVFLKLEMVPQDIT